MKFLVLALCVCAASAASFGSYGSRAQQYYQPSRQVAQATASVVASPVVAAEEVFIAPAKTAYKTAEFVASAPIAAAKATYNTAQLVATAPAVASRTVFSGKESEASILRSDSDVTAEGFNYLYETGNGISSQVSGTLKKVDGADVIVSQGSYQYTAPDGTPVQFSYVADENGYQPRGDLLPVGPAIPEAILRSLEYIRAHPQKPENY